MNLSCYTCRELQKMREELNFTEEELSVFNLLAKGKSRVEISMRLSMSTRTIDRRIQMIKIKLNK